MAMFILWTFVLCCVSFSTCNSEVDSANDGGENVTSVDTSLKDNTNVTFINYKDDSSSKTLPSTDNPGEHQRVTLPTTTETQATGSLKMPYVPTTPMPYIPISTKTSINTSTYSTTRTTESINDAGIAPAPESTLNLDKNVGFETKSANLIATLISTSAPIDENRQTSIPPISEIPDTTTGTSTAIIVQSTGERTWFDKNGSNTTEGVDNEVQPKLVLLPSDPTVLPDKGDPTTSKDVTLQYGKFQYDAPTPSHATNSSKEYQQHENGKSSSPKSIPEQEIHKDSGKIFDVVLTEHAGPITDSSVVPSTTSSIPRINNDTTHGKAVSLHTSLESSLPSTPLAGQEGFVTENVKKAIFNETQRETTFPSESKREEHTTNVKTTSGSGNQLSPPKPTGAQNASESSKEIANNIEINTTATPPTTLSPSNQSNLLISATSPGNKSKDTATSDSEKNNSVHQFFIDLRVHTVMCVIAIFIILLTITVIFSFVLACVFTCKYMGIGLYKLGKNTQKCFQRKNSSTSNQESGSLFPRCDVAIRPYPQDDSERY